MAGGTIFHKTRFQNIVVLSLTKAELIAACNTGKNCLYGRSILDDLDITQEHTIIIYEDNKAATAMANTKKSIKRTKHINTRYFALQSWLE